MRSLFMFVAAVVIAGTIISYKGWSLWDAPFWSLPLISFAITQVGAVYPTTIYLHRALAHRSIVVRGTLAFFFRLALWFVTGLKREEWVGTHRIHHANTDKEGDPHSPRVFGFWKIQLWNVYYYIQQAGKAETREVAKDIKNDWLERHIFGHSLVGLFLGIVASFLCFGVIRGGIIAVLHAITYVFVLSPLVNGLAHWRGQQNFRNTAYNWPKLSWLVGGELLHNNHHAGETSPSFAARPGEIDSGYEVASIFERVGALRFRRPIRFRDPLRGPEGSPV
jgi:stearoyl-CoA desaturase (delta-9 desaturase)